MVTGKDIFIAAVMAVLAVCALFTTAGLYFAGRDVVRHLRNHKL